MGSCAAVLLVLAVGAASGISAAPRPAERLVAANAEPAGPAHALSLDRLVVHPPPMETPPAELPAPPPPVDPPTEIVIAPPPAVFDAPAAPPAAPPAALQSPSRFQGVSPSGGTWAVMIGVNDYPGQSSDLRAAVNDATDMDLALARLGVPAGNRLLLRDGQASSAMILTAVDWLNAHAGPNATAVFFYSGHVRKVARTTEAIVAADGGTVTDEELAARLAPLQAKRAWIAIAACYGAGFTEVLAPGRVLTGAASADALAYESSLYKRSYMVQYMIRQALIERRTATTVQAAYAYARSELDREHPNRQPVQIDAGSGLLDLRPGANAAATGTGGPPPPPSAGSPPTSGPPRNCFLLVCSG